MIPQDRSATGMGIYVVILTLSTGHAVRAEKVLIAAGIEAKMIPVPRHLSSDCGVSVRIKQQDQSAAEALLKEKGVPIDRIVPFE